MPSTITAEKATLRKAVKEFCLSETQKARSDTLLLQRFLAFPQLLRSTHVLLYYGVGAEPDTAALLAPLEKAGKVTALPRCLSGGAMEARRYLGPDQLVPDPFGIPQPDESCPVLAPDAFSLILVPALCCDERGYRLGHGGGYYDRYLPRSRAVTVALCRDALLRPHLPTEAHDVPVDIVLTETRCLSRL